ncbi:MAG TPA: hypothetical protein DDY70_02165, partial [Clostridiales bacterium]|nr:hypothetical protein [Clostridiales bacterium]
MKRRFFSGILAVILFLLVLLFPLSSSDLALRAQASGNLDEILKYEVTVKPRPDATLDITYRIRWKVLDSDVEGPLSWVKIGVANMYVDEIRPLDDSIASAEYSYDSGAFVRIDFDREYYEGEIVDFGFSLHQSRIFSLANGGTEVEFAFIPGWFEEIRVDEMILRWDISDVDSDDILYCTGKNEENSYAVWTEKDMPENRKLQSQIKYKRSVFPTLDEDAVYSDRQASDGTIFLTRILPFLILAVIVAVMIAAVLIERHRAHDDYYHYRGYAGPYRYWGYPFSHGVNSRGKRIHLPPTTTGGNGGSTFGSGGGCACACACACAGGGR